MSRCFTPIQISPKMKNYNGKSQKSDSENLVTVPCGQCIGCRFNRAENWATRMMHEAQLHEHNSFLTLTYANDNLPPDGSLAPRDVTLFLKKLRKALCGKKILYYYCGEYGEEFSRPHYHVALFGHDFSADRVPHYKTDSGYQVHRSPLLEKLWTHGHSDIGDLTYDSARYVAGYIQKKVNGKKAKEHYKKLNPQTGEVHYVHPEFARMSRRPAIGLNWISKHSSDIYNYDVCHVANKKLRPPAYYDKWLKKTDEKKYESIKMSRESSAIDAPTIDTARLIKTYEAKVIASKKLHRSLESVPAHTPDSDLLDYHKRSHEQQHFIERKKKWNQLTYSAQSTTTNQNSSGLHSSLEQKLTSLEDVKQPQKTKPQCLTSTLQTSNSISLENGTKNQLLSTSAKNDLALSSTSAH